MKKPKTYNLHKDVISAINAKAKADDRKDSDWLNRYLMKALKVNSKPKAPAESKNNNAVADNVAGYVPCSNGTYEVMQSSIDTWANAYPNVDIGAELNKVVAWLDSNPKKTVNGCKKFLNSWLSRAQNSASSTIKTNGAQQVRGSSKTAGNLSACEDFING